MADVWKVLTNSDPSRVRTLFQGLEKDARAYIANHFPRPHVEPPSQDPGVHDVKLSGPGGVEDFYHADDGWNSENQPTSTVTETDTVDNRPGVKPAAPVFTKPGQASSPTLV